MSETPSKAAVDGLNREAQMTSRKVISNRKIGNLNKSLEKVIDSRSYYSSLGQQ